jgi:hypothetical protein
MSHESGPRFESKLENLSEDELQETLENAVSNATTPKEAETYIQERLSRKYGQLFNVLVTKGASPEAYLVTVGDETTNRSFEVHRPDAKSAAPAKTA